MLSWLEILNVAMVNQNKFPILDNSRLRTLIVSRPPANSRLSLTVRGVVVWCWILLNFQPLLAQDSSTPTKDAPTKFLTGKDLDEKLQLSISVTYSNARLREELAKFSVHERVGVFIDRRVDPATPFTLTISDGTFEQVLWKIAEQTGLGICRLGDVFYLGPPETAKALRVLWHELTAETKRIQKQSEVPWNRRSKVVWAELSQPNQVLIQLADENGFSIENASASDTETANLALPHDLWPLVQLPDLRLDEQIALLCVGFERWFKRNQDGSIVSITQLPVVDHGQVEWAVGKDFKSRLADLKNQFPGCQCVLRGQLLQARGPTADLDRMEATLVRWRVPQQGAGEVYTLSTHATREQILATIAQRTSRSLEFPPELKRVLDQRIELNVQNVTLEKLIDETLRGSGLKYRMETDKLVIHN